VTIPGLEHRGQRALGNFTSRLGADLVA
jgi:hypothetical protein